MKIHSCVLYVVLLIGGLLKIHSCVSYDAVLIVTLLIGGLLRNVSVCSSAYWGLLTLVLHIIIIDRLCFLGVVQDIFVCIALFSYTVISCIL